MELSMCKSRLIIREVNHEDSILLAKILVKRPKTVLLVYHDYYHHYRSTNP